jgi:CubicO group peptidase (beta-lactamase class C family)
MAAGFSAAGLQRLNGRLAGDCDSGAAPGVVIGLSRGDEVHVDAVGTAAVGGGEAMAPDALFRITSMTRPLTAVATLQLVEAGTLRLDEAVDDLLPELSGRRVLRELNGPIDDTVAAHRPITVRDLLTFRWGFGMILAPPSEYPILEAEAALGLHCVGPPVPAPEHPPDEWMRRLGTLPLMDQPGEQWRYSTGSMILGVLVSRAAGQPAEAFYEQRLFAPLGMKDTRFWVPADEAARLAPCYQPTDGGLAPFDDGGQWLRPPVFPDCGAGLISTAADYLAFARMLLAGGKYEGQPFLSPDSVTAMTADQLTPGQRETAGPILDGRGWGFGVSIIDQPEAPVPSRRGYGWNGGFGTAWANDPDRGLAAVLLTQVLAFPGVAIVERDFWTGVYAALDG